jgi:hypothetical protein
MPCDASASAHLNLVLLATVSDLNNRAEKEP